MTTPAERPSPEIRALVEQYGEARRQQGVRIDEPEHIYQRFLDDSEATEKELLAALGAMEEDKQRLDFIEQVADDNVRPDKGQEDILRLGKYNDDDGVPYRSWSTMGHGISARWGSGWRIGKAPTLRESIDRAMASIDTALNAGGSSNGRR